MQTDRHRRPGPDADQPVTLHGVGDVTDEAEADPTSEMPATAVVDGVSEGEAEAAEASTTRMVHTLHSEHALLHRVFGLLERVERQDGAGVLAFHDGGLSRADVVVSHRRLCLVVDPAMPDLADLAADVDPELVPVLVEARRRAQQQRRRLGEVLLELGEALEQRVRNFFLYQCARGMISVAETHMQAEQEFYAVVGEAALEWAVHWIPARADYEAKLTFSPLDVYLATASLLEIDRNDIACKLFAELSGSANFGLLLLQEQAGQTLGMPVAIAGRVPASMVELRRASYALHTLMNPLAMNALSMGPQLLAYGRTWNDMVCLNGGRHVALLYHTSVGGKARAASRAFALSAMVHTKGYDDAG